MKIKINLSEVYFLKLVLQTFLKSGNEDKQMILLAKDILNKLNK